MINSSMIYVAELLIADRAEVLRQHVNIATSASEARAGSTLKRNNRSQPRPPEIPKKGSLSSAKRECKIELRIEYPTESARPKEGNRMSGSISDPPGIKKIL